MLKTELNGLEAAPRIREVSPTSKILFVSESRSADIVDAALSNGACGYVVKSDAATDLLFAIEAVLEGKRFLSASLTGCVLVTSKTGASQGERPTDDNPYLRFAKNSHISKFLEAVMDSTAADFCAVQLYDSKNHLLKIVAEHGFDSEFLDNLHALGDNVRSACNESMNEQCRVVVKDVATDPSNSSTPWIIAASGFSQ